jgi:hypothetical protein
MTISDDIAALTPSVDATYPDRSPGDAAHQQDHDRLHRVMRALTNAGVDQDELVGILEALLNGSYVGVGLVPAPPVGKWFDPLGGITWGGVIHDEADIQVGPLWLPSGTYDAVGWNVTVAGSTGSRQRAVIYADNGSGAPGVVALDSGQVNAETTGQKQVTGLSLVVGTFGLYWGGVVNQGGASTRATFSRALTARSNFGGLPAGLAGTYPLPAPRITGLTGGPTDNPTVTDIATNPAALILRRSA